MRQRRHQFGAVAQLVARATPVRKVIWSRRASKDHDVKEGENSYQFGAVAQLVARGKFY
ncbi:unnamed protein product [Penicillium viridicatum]